MTIPAKDATDNRGDHGHQTRAAAHRNLAVAAGRQLHPAGMTLDSLVDVDAPRANDGDLLTADGTGMWRAHAVPKPALSDLTDVDMTTPPTGGQMLSFLPMSNKWIPLDSKLANLTDVDAVTKAPAAGDLLTADGAGMWRPNAPQSYSRAEVDNKISALVGGLEHEEAVLSRVDAPPATPATYDLHIVGTSPTGAWATHANDLAEWDGKAWQFTAPRANEAHLVEAEAATYTWNGTSWVKVALATTSAASGDVWQVGSIQQSLLTETQWATTLGAESTKWVLCDGRNVFGSKWAAITGQTSVPDMRGAFFRAAGQNTNAGVNWNGKAVGSYHDDTTRIPRNTAFSLDNPGDHNHTIDAVGDHTHTVQYASGNSKAGPDYIQMENWGDGRKQTSAAGGHNHTIHAAGGHTHTISGGDVETAPVHFSLNTFIKIN
jgi:hypothetical protein